MEKEGGVGLGRCEGGKGCGVKVGLHALSLIERLWAWFSR